MTPIDRQERQQALDIHHSFIVQAPAGSGKTGVLTQRILTLLARVERPEQILAITFTKKAAAEMRNRVMEALHTAAHGDEPADAHDRDYYRLARQVLARDQARQWGLLDNPGRLRLQTIDSLCSAIVRENPLLSGLGVQFGVEPDAREQHAAAARALLAMLGDDSAVSHALVRVLDVFDNQTRKLQTLIVAMLEQRDHWLRDITETHQQWPAFRQLLETSLARLNEETEARVWSFFSPAQRRELDAVCVYARNQLRLANSTVPLALEPPESQAYRQACCKLLLTKDKEPAFRKTLNKNDGFPGASNFQNAAEKADATAFKQRALSLIESLQDNGEELIAAIQGFVQVPASILSEPQWQLLTDLVLLVRYAAGHLQLVFQERRLVDFSEVALSALRSLGHPDQPGDSLLALDERIQHILVDEFQDTSLIQVDLLEKLTAGWSDGDGRSLFLVGDPMQSIYAFRKADVGLFLRIWQEQRIGQVPLQRLQLRTNFRSSPRVLDWVNDIFGRAFPRHDDIRGGAVRYAASVAGRELRPRDCTELHLFTGEDSLALAQAEADWIADRILAREGNPSTAILVKGKSHILAIADALRRKAIPFQAVEIERLAESALITDLLSLFRAYLSPGDAVAWFALLRGPWCGFTLTELQQVADTDPHPWRAVQRLRQAGILPAPAQTRLDALVERMALAYHERFQQPFAEALRQLALDLGIAATASTPADLDAMELFFTLLTQTPGVGGVPDPAVLAQQLQALYVPPEPVTDERQPVQVMTMHKSKGLEFDEVFLPQLQRKGRADDAPLILIDRQTGEQETRQELFMAPLDKRRGADSRLFDTLWRLRKQRSRHEAARLLYVACTRARRQLILTACLKTNGDKSPKPDAASLLHLIWNQVEASAQCHPIEPLLASARARPFRRLQALPAPSPRPRPVSSLAAVVEETQAGPFADDTYHRHAGILVHRILEQWARRPALIDSTDTDAMSPRWQQALTVSGVCSDDLAPALAIVQAALARLRQNPARLDWLFRQPHAESAAEWRLSCQIEGQLQHFTIDRTFVQAGVRHVIDYKTAQTHDDPATFLREQGERYRPQLTAYRQTLAALENRPCRTWLYFPLMDLLHEIED